MNGTIIDTDQAHDLIQRLRSAMTPVKMNRLADRVAQETLADVQRATPKGWFGETRRGWHIQKPALAVRIIANNMPSMRFLEYGTKTHGPVRARFLYIPKTRRAAGGWHAGLKRGVDYILVKRVRGIAPRNIVAGARERAEARLFEGAKDLIREAIHG